MTIHIESLRVDAIIGLLDFEREMKQRIFIDLEALYDYSDNSFINYADLAELIEMRIRKECYFLLEEALLDLKKIITEAYPSIEKLNLKISKPDILENCAVALSDRWDISPDS